MSDEREGDEAEAVEGALEGAEALAEAAGGLVPEGEAREGLEAASQVAGAASSAVQAGRGLASSAQTGDVGSATGALGGATSDASRYVVPEGEAQQALQGAGQVARGVGGALGDALGGQRDDVEYHLEIDGVDARWGVRSVTLRERLGGLSEAVIEVRAEDGGPEVRELLDHDLRLTIERTAQQRSFRGIVRHATKHGDHGATVYRIHAVPALWLLTQRVGSRIYQDRTVPAIVEELYEELLGGRHRELSNTLSREYPTYEYVVQYQESCFAFLSRLLEQEGIFFFFDHEEGDHEVLVLADSNADLPQARPDDQGRVPFWENPEQAPDHEAVYGAEHHEELGTTDAVVGDYDWTNPTLTVRGEQTGRGESEPALELYDHTDAVQLHDYDEGGGQHRANTSESQVRLRAELLDLTRQGWHMESTVVTARPGHLFELSGCPDPSLDGRYLIVSCHARGTATEGSSGSYANVLECVPSSLPYRPPRKTPRPTVHGPESGIVVGPAGEEIHTDPHGRVKVQLYWDRLGENDERSSCWLRVSQTWAGPGWGTMFIPRIGMEAVVHFFGGNPDRPFVSSCLYNGQNRPPYPLPDEKTKSTVKSNSSPGGGGSNELRFEDKAGSEEIYLHAQKDLDEVVEHCHSTHVKVDQSNTVDHDHTETVGNDQTLEVKGERMKTVHKPETTYVFDTRTETVHGVETLDLRQTRQTTIGEDEDLTIQGNRKMHVDGRDDEEIVGGREVTVSEFDNLKVIGGANRNETVSGQYNITVDGAHYTLVQGGTEKLTQGSQKTYLESAKEVHAKTGSSHLLMKNDGNIKVAGDTKIELEVGGCKIEMTTQKITLTAGASSIELGPSGVKTSGSTVTSSAQTMNEITGLLVKIN